MATKGWTVWSEAQARAELALWKKSGQSLLKFAEERGYSDSRLRWWRTRIGDVRPAQPTELVAVRIVGAECAAASVETAIEVVLHGGHVLRLRRGFAIDTLMSVVGALEQSC